MGFWAFDNKTPDKHPKNLCPLFLQNRAKAHFFGEYLGKIVFSYYFSNNLKTPDLLLFFNCPKNFQNFSEKSGLFGQKWAEKNSQNRTRKPVRKILRITQKSFQEFYGRAKNSD